jgi:hypothetical protein
MISIVSISESTLTVRMFSRFCKFFTQRLEGRSSLTVYARVGHNYTDPDDNFNRFLFRVLLYERGKTRADAKFFIFNFVNNKKQRHFV